MWTVTLPAPPEFDRVLYLWTLHPPGTGAPGKCHQGPRERPPPKALFVKALLDRKRFHNP